MEEKNFELRNDMENNRGRKASRIVIRYGQYGRKASRRVKRYEKY
jgi:hypothetical protein